MTAAVVNIEIDAAATAVWEYDWVDPSTNLPINLGTYSAHMQVRAAPYDTIVLLDFSTANGKITLGGAAGTISVKFLPADTTATTWSKGVYDLYLTDTSNGTVTAVARGAVILLTQTTV